MSPALPWNRPDEVRPRAGSIPSKLGSSDLDRHIALMHIHIIV